MIYITQNEINIVVISLSVTIVIAVAIFALVKFSLNLRKIKRTDLKIESSIKDYEKRLNVFFDALGGTQNVIKLQVDDEKNCLTSILRNVDEANVTILEKYNLQKFEKFEDRIDLYFDNSRQFYDSLFGK